jgi:hypothetical protein
MDPEALWEGGSRRVEYRDRRCDHPPLVIPKKDGKSLVSGPADNSQRLWRVADGSLLRRLAGGMGPVLGELGSLWRRNRGGLMERLTRLPARFVRQK